jgi:hypothetical protein
MTSIPLVFPKPRKHDELLSFVAHFGSRVTNATTKCNLEDVAIRAVTASRQDPSLARMLPVFLFRSRNNLKLHELVSKAVACGCASRLGYLLEVTIQVSSVRTFRPTLASLRRHAHADRPIFFFARTENHPFEAMVAGERTPQEARRWGLLTGTPLDSFSTYFNKVARL